MTSSAPLSCAVCSVKFEDLDSLLQHMAGHTAPASPAPASAAGQQTSARQIVLSRTAFLRLKPMLQQSASRSVVTIVTEGGGRGLRRPIRPRPHPPPATAPVDLDVEVLEPAEPTELASQVSPVDPDNIECCVCRRRFKHKYSLVAHCRQHLMSRLCGVCHRRMPDGQALVEHLETHMEKNSTFKCDQCEKSFVHAKSLYVHKRNHSGVRPYTCQYCHKTFRHWHKHRVHVRIHTGERPYRCDICGWGFPRNDERKRHMRTHVGAKAFHCIDCGVGCGTQMALMRHQELHHSSMVPSLEEGRGEKTAEEEGETEAAEAAPAETVPGVETEESFADLDEQITVKVEMDDPGVDVGCNDGSDVGSGDCGEDGDGGGDGGGDVDDGDDDGGDGDDDGGDCDDPPYRPESDSDSDASGGSDRRDTAPARKAPSIGRAAPADHEEEDEDGGEGEQDAMPNSADHQPQRDPIAIDEPNSEKTEENSDATVAIKTEPKEEEEEPAGAEDSHLATLWGSDSDSERDAESARLLEPEVNLTEMFIDIERMRTTIRRKIAANAHKFDNAVAQEARSFVHDPEPDIDNIRSILRTKLEEGKRIQALLARNETDKRQLQDELEATHKKIKLEPVETYSGMTVAKRAGINATSLTAKAVAPSQKGPRGRVRRLAPAVSDVGRHWLAGRLSPEDGDSGRTSDPSATPRVPRRRWIQHELNFAPEDGTLAEAPPLGGSLRISTGFGEL